MSSGRPRTFDESEVVERAMLLFWRKGYEAAGLTELCDDMGISRQSLYNAFGSKRGLFVRALVHYRETQLSTALALLDDEERPHLDRVRAVAAFFEALALDTECRGCLVANALVEVAPHDEEMAGLLSETLETLRLAIEESLTQALRSGELRAGKDPVRLSRALTNALIGLAVTGKIRLPRDHVRDIYAGTLSLLD